MLSFETRSRPRDFSRPNFHGLGLGLGVVGPGLGLGLGLVGSGLGLGLVGPGLGLGLGLVGPGLGLGLGLVGPGLVNIPACRHRISIRSKLFINPRIPNPGVRDDPCHI